MNNKSRKAKIKAEEPQPVIVIPEIITSQCKNEEINKILNDFQSRVDVEARITLIRSLAGFLSSDDSEFIIMLLSHLFVNLSTKSPVKKSILRIFVKSKSVHVSAEISKQLLVLIKTNRTDLSELNDIVCAINDCFNNCPPGVQAVKLVLSEVLEFLIIQLKTLISKQSTTTIPVQLQDLYSFIHNCTRCFVAITQIDDAIPFIQKHDVEILDLCKIMLGNPELVFDTKLNCGIMITTIINAQTKFSKLVGMCIKQNDVIEEGNIRDVANICIYSGILIVVKPNMLTGYARMLHSITVSLKMLQKRSTENPTVVLGVFRGLLLVTRVLQSTPQACQEDIRELLLGYIMNHLDHSVDTIRHLVRSMFINLVKLKPDEIKYFYRPDPLNKIIKKVLNIAAYRTSRYTALSVIANEIRCSILLDKHEPLVSELLDVLHDTSISNCVVACYETLMRCNLKETTETEWFHTWVLPLTAKLTVSGELDQTETCVQRLLMLAIKLRPNMLDSILAQWSTTDVIQLSSLLKCALIARKIGMTEPTIDKWRGILDFSILEDSKCHQNDEIRIASLTLVTESHKTTEIFTHIELKYIVSFLHYNINTQLPSTRQQILGLIRKILNRFAAGYYAILRDYSKIVNRTPANPVFLKLQHQKHDYEQFVYDLRGCVFASLFPTANFSRRIIGLEILTNLETILCDLDGISSGDIWTKVEVDSMLTCLNDTYESNKRLAVDLLGKCPVVLLGLNDCISTKSYLNQALKLAKSVKPAETATAAYMFQTCMYATVLNQVLLELLPHEPPLTDTNYLLIQFIILQLENEISIARKSLFEASIEAPMHGLLFSLRHLLEHFMFDSNFIDTNWRLLIAKLIELCFEINELVAPIVNNSSPEGHLPMDHSADFDDPTITAQMLLVCSWRSVKEVSLLLGDLTEKSHIVNEHGGLITEEQILQIGEHFRVLLTETKHRGAFEQAYVGFAKLCTRLWKCNSGRLHKLPVVWLKYILDAISGKSNNSKLCATRRSAGVPFMIQAIVASELQTGSQIHFDKCITTLLRYASSSDDNIELRTHSMNILRTLYRHTQLGDVVTPFIADAIIISIEAIEKTTWAERNSATLLFSSLMTRIFGVQRSKDTDRLNIRNQMNWKVFFTRFPSVRPFLLKQLKGLTSTKCPPCQEAAMYPILVLLDRLYPSTIKDYKNLEEFKSLLHYCTSNKTLKTRELTAKVLVKLIDRQSYTLMLMNLFDDLRKPIKNQNSIHDILLQIEQLLLQTNELNGVFIIRSMEWLLYMPTATNLIISTLYLQILNLIARDQVLCTTDWLFLFKLEKKKKDFKIGHKLFETTKLLTQLNVTSKFDTTIRIKSDKLLHLIINNLKSPNLPQTEQILNILIYFLSNTRLDISDREIELVDTFSTELRDAIRDKLNTTEFFGVLNELLNTKCAGKVLEVLSNYPDQIAQNGRNHSTNLFLFYIDRVHLEPDAVFSCIRVCFKIYKPEECSKIDWLTIAELLLMYSTLDKSLRCRVRIALIVTENPFLLRDHFKPECLLESLFTYWQIVFQLLDDSEPEVRNIISTLATNSPIAEKSRELLLNDCVEVFKNISESTAISLLLYWATIDREPINLDSDLDQEVFEKGETSTYVETMCLSLLSAKSLAAIMRSDKETGISAIFHRIIAILRDNCVFWKHNMQEKDTLVSIFTELAIKTTDTAIFDAYSISSMIPDHIWSNIDEEFKFKTLKIVEYLI